MKNIFLILIILILTIDLSAQLWKELGNDSFNKKFIYKLHKDKKGVIYGVVQDTNIIQRLIIVKWNGKSWIKLNTDTLLCNNVTVMASDYNDNLYIGAKSNTTKHLYRWNGSSWLDMNAGNNGLNSYCEDFNSISFDKAGNVYVNSCDSLSSIKKWNGTNWIALNNRNGPYNLYISQVAIDKEDNIYSIGGTSQGYYIYIYKWNGNEWIELNIYNQNSFSNSTKLYSDYKGVIYSISQGMDSLNVLYFNIHKLIGDKWQNIGDLKNDLSINDLILSIDVDSNDNIYIGGKFTNSIGNTYIAKWNGLNWSELGTGKNKLEHAEDIETIISDKNSNVYTVSKYTYSYNHQYVAKWNGINWSELGGNALPKNSSINTMTVDKFGYLYAGGSVSDPSGKIRVLKWNGNNWQYLNYTFNRFRNDIVTYNYKSLIVNDFDQIIASGLITNSIYTQPIIYDGNDWKGFGQSFLVVQGNKNINTMCTDSKGQVYLAGGFQENARCVVYKWNDTNLTELKKDTNRLNANDDINTMTIDSLDNVYVAGNFTNSIGKNYVSKWNGNFWTELGIGTNRLNANNSIYSIISDKSGNIYAAGLFTNTNGKYYVAKWDGISWTSLGNLNLNGAVNSLCFDSKGNIYAGGNFKNSREYNYVMKWNGTGWLPIDSTNGIYSSDTSGYSTYITCIKTDQLDNLYVSGGFKNKLGNFYVAVNQSCNSSSNLFKTICINQLPYNWFGKNFTLSHLADTIIRKNSKGCDSFIKLFVDITSSKNIYINKTICSNQLPFNLYGKIFTSTRLSDTIFGKNISGCDSNIIINLTILKSGIKYDSIEICSTDLPYTWFGKVFTKTKLKDSLFIKLNNGCDSIIILKVNLIPINRTLTKIGDTLKAPSSIYYQWIDCNTKLPINGALNQKFVPKVKGLYAAIIIQNGCYDTTNCIQIFNSSINELKNDKFNIYPNPSKNILFIESNYYDYNINLEIFDLEGKLYFSRKLQKGVNQIDLSIINNGKYIVFIKKNDVVIHSKKIVKE